MKLLQRYSLFILLSLNSISWAHDQVLEINDAWVREGPPTARVLAAYMQLVNHSDEDVILVSFEACNFNNAELHQTLMQDGMAQMHQHDRLVIPAGGSLILEPNGYHLMLIDPNKPILAGQDIEIILDFADGRHQGFVAEVRRVNGDDAADHSHHNH